LHLSGVKAKEAPEDGVRAVGEGSGVLLEELEHILVYLDLSHAVTLTRRADEIAISLKFATMCPMTGPSSSFQLTVHGDIHLTINHVEARQGAAPVDAFGSVYAEKGLSRARVGSLASIGGRWLLQVVAAMSSSAAAIGLLSALGIG
jgi:hypothetical protein